MHNTNITHHHSVAAICFFPLFLLIVASLWGNIQTELSGPYFEQKANRAEQKLHLTKTQFRHVQKAYSLLTEGEAREIFHPVAAEPTHALSAFERYRAAAKHIAMLQPRVDAIRASVNAIGEKVVHIDLSDQEISFVSNGEIVASYPASTGKSSTPTPTGRFQIHRKQDLRVSNQDVPYRMPNYMAFTPNQAYGMHALPYLGEGPESSDYWQEALEHIGTPVSHGCVRLLPEDALDLYERIEVGTAVVINT